MNLVLLDEKAPCYALPVDDRRAVHLREVLGVQAGDTFDCGTPNGPLGKARVTSIGKELMYLEVTWREVPPPPPPLILGVGLSRPQTMRKLLREAPSLGVRELAIFPADKSEHAYGMSQLWTSGEWQRQIQVGLEQAFTTRAPMVRHYASVESWARRVPASAKVALDLYEAETSLAEVPLGTEAVALAIGPERGWDADDRHALRGAGFALARMGELVMRTETAVVAGCAVVASRMGWAR